MNKPVETSAAAAQSETTTSTETETETQTETTTPEGTLLGGGTSQTETTETDEGASETETFEPHTADTLKEIIGGEAPELNEELANDFLEIVNESKMPREAVEKLMGMQDRLMAQVTDAMAAQWNQTKSDWTKTINTEFPGEKLDAEQARIGALIDEFGDQELREHLNLTGAGDSPALFRFLSKISTRLVKEGQPMGGKATSAQPTLAERMYPTMQREGA